MAAGGSWLFEWWTGLSPWIRYGMALGLLAVAVLLFLSGYWYSAASAWVASFIIFLLAGRSDSEKKGYWW